MTPQIRNVAGCRTGPDPTVPDAADERGSDPARHGFVHQVQQLLDSLDQPDREALRLIYFRGLTQDDAARALGVPQTVLRSCVARGMRELGRRLLASAP